MALAIFIIRYAGMSLFIFLIAMVLGSLQDWLYQNVNGLYEMTGSHIAQASSDHIVGNFILGLWLLGFILFVVGVIIAWLKYINFSYCLKEFDLILKRGILDREEITIPYRQMQDINVNRTFLYRILGVSKLIIDSAGHEEAEEQNETDVILEPIDKAAAEEIRDILQRRIGVQVIETEKEADREAQDGDPH